MKRYLFVLLTIIAIIFIGCATNQVVEKPEVVAAEEQEAVVVEVVEKATVQPEVEVAEMEAAQVEPIQTWKVTSSEPSWNGQKVNLPKWVEESLIYVDIYEDDSMEIRTENRELSIFADFYVDENLSLIVVPTEYRDVPKIVVDAFESFEIGLPKEFIFSFEMADNGASSLSAEAFAYSFTSEWELR